MLYEEIKITLSRVENDHYLDIEDVALFFWESLQKLIIKYAGKKESVKKITNFYLYDCIDDLRWSDNSISLIFSDASGYCSLSYLICHHWAEIVLAVNEVKFKKQFRSLGWEVQSNFKPLHEIKESQNKIFIEQNKSLYALQKEHSDSPYLYCDQGQELEYSDLTKAKQEKFLSYLQTGKCQCPLCLKIENGKLNPGNVYVYENIVESWKSSYSIESALPYHRIVESIEISFYKEKNIKEPVEQLSKFKKLKKLRLGYMGLKKLPESIASLTNLTSLDISDNPIEELDDFIGNLENLEELVLCDTEIKKLPESIFKLTKLKNLVLNKHIKDVPAEFK